MPRQVRIVTEAESLGLNHYANGPKGTMFGRQTEPQATIYTITVTRMAFLYASIQIRDICEISRLVLRLHVCPIQEYASIECGGLGRDRCLNLLGLGNFAGELYEVADGTHSEPTIRHGPEQAQVP